MNHHTYVFIFIVMVKSMPIHAASTKSSSNEDSNDTKIVQDSHTTTVKPENISDEGASRGAFGMLADPHPAIEAVFDAPVHWHKTEACIPQGISSKLDIIPEKFRCIVIPHSRKPDSHNHYFKGLAVRVDQKHLLMDKYTFERYGEDEYRNLKFTPIGIYEYDRPKETIDVKEPGEEHYQHEDIDFKLVPKETNLNGTHLGLYKIEDKTHLPTADRFPDLFPVAKLETNPDEFGSNCTVHGYGQISSSSARIDSSAFYNDTKRHYVMAPIDDGTKSHCRDNNECELSTTDGYSFCQSAGAGSPVFCGKDQKLTYMVKHEKLSESADCRQIFTAYHIPRLVESMGSTDLYGR